MGAQVLGDALRCIDRHFWELRRQHGQTRPVIEMNMRKNDALDRLAEASSVGGGLCRVWQEELTVKDDELFRPLDDLFVGEEPILRATPESRSPLSAHSAATGISSICSCRITPESGSNSPTHGVRSRAASVCE